MGSSDTTGSPTRVTFATRIPVTSSLLGSCAMRILPRWLSVIRTHSRTGGRKPLYGKLLLLYRQATAFRNSTRGVILSPHCMVAWRWASETS
ncbi:hypothetical protein SS1G_12825 [Sclerotinia sclerotiorum 1980 UF-70]|uniref:Uncharacterized protein n=1 Tax=Sclerotinia sclerotiorum (strain ATCC 18683 / 1980 / Ss-1) TaxID=665079 RepID=A7F5E7_SCLS1|nr:hypothetical protein SS1G_12825 [Sclerotinia sclerotiorum 1980 UF-70]EDN97968.1 hypothetical protein SS1G_12825 [Sclerotinia sclerotiorum 1980 UF-70]